jgi:hypothetical protein
MVTGYPELVNQFGLADSAQKLVLESYATNFANAVKTGDYLEAYRQFDQMINGDTLGPSYYTNITQIGYFRCCSGISGCVVAADGRCNYSILAAAAL